MLSTYSEFFQKILNLLQGAKLYAISLLRKKPPQIIAQAVTAVSGLKIKQAKTNRKTVVCQSVYG